MSVSAAKFTDVQCCGPAGTTTDNVVCFLDGVRSGALLPGRELSPRRTRGKSGRNRGRRAGSVAGSIRVPARSERGLIPERLERRGR